MDDIEEDLKVMVERGLKIDDEERRSSMGVKRRSILRALRRERSVRRKEKIGEYRDESEYKRGEYKMCKNEKRMGRKADKNEAKSEILYFEYP